MSRRPKVLVTHWVHAEVLEKLSRDADVVANRSTESLSRAALLDRARGAQGVLAFMPDRIDAEFLAACPGLQVVAGAFKGADNVDLEACAARGVRVSVVPDLLTEPTAELAVTLLLGLGRRLLEGDREVRAGGFRGWRPILYGGGLLGSTVGLIGMGAVGQAIAARLVVFGCRLLYTDARERPGAVPRVELQELLTASDRVVVALPLTPETRGLLGPRALAGMKPGALLVNVGRGSVVDEIAVARALRSGRLGGYAADVFACEDLSIPERPAEIPPELLAPDLRTLFTPHLGSAVDEARLAIALSAAQSIQDHLRGFAKS
jgi:phosphonate dehydrogenase